MTRRTFNQGTALTVLAALASTALPLPGLMDRAFAEAVDAKELATPNPLGEMVMGDDKAPVTVIEYASMTCPHCAHFTTATLPEIKKQFIDTGKVKYILREFPLDPLAAAGFMLARCAGKDDNSKYFAMVDTLFHQLNTWAVRQPLEPLKAISKQAGLSEQDFNACLANQAMLDKIEKVRDHAANKLGVQSTPTFFVNGNKYPGDLSLEEMSKLIKAYL